MKIFAIDQDGVRITLHLPSGRRVAFDGRTPLHTAVALGQQVLAALSDSDEPRAAVDPVPSTPLQHLRNTVLDVLRPAPGETFNRYADRVQASGPEVLFRTLQKVTRR